MKKTIITFLSMFTMLVISCKKESKTTPQPNPIMVQTFFDVANVTSNSALIDGLVSNDNGDAITERGVCFGVNSNPTTSNAKVTSGTGWGAFTVTITGLVLNTQYFAKAYAISSQGTSYGNEISFTTLGIANFPSVVIGTQTWMANNLEVDRYRNGEAIPRVEEATTWGSLTTGAYCYWQNQSSNGTIYGKLYNWYAVNDPRGLAPTGWHIPSDTEWTTLIDFLGGEAVAGGKMKEAGTSHWLTPNTGADNSSGFGGLPGGSRTDGASANFPFNLGYLGIWWSSTEVSNKGVVRYLTNDNQNVVTNRYFEQGGFSVRCIKD